MNEGYFCTPCGYHHGNNECDRAVRVIETAEAEEQRGDSKALTGEAWMLWQDRRALAAEIENLLDLLTIAKPFVTSPSIAKRISDKILSLDPERRAHPTGDVGG